ncbi:10866_t:CDS:1, partial [Entrophospora sp. SA101]
RFLKDTFKEHPKILDVDFGGGKNDVGRSDGRDNNNHKKSGFAWMYLLVYLIII